MDPRGIDPGNTTVKWPWLLVITGYFYGIIHFINGGFLVLISGITWAITASISSGDKIDDVTTDHGSWRPLAAGLSMDDLVLGISGSDGVEVAIPSIKGLPSGELT